MSSSAASVSDQESGYFTDAQSHIDDDTSIIADTHIPISNTSNPVDDSVNSQVEKDNSSVTPQATITEQDKVSPMKADPSDVTAITIDKESKPSSEIISKNVVNLTISPPPSVSNIPTDPVTPSRRTLDPSVLANSPYIEPKTPVLFNDSDKSNKFDGIPEKTKIIEEASTSTTTAISKSESDIINQQPTGASAPEYKKTSESSTTTEGTSSDSKKPENDTANIKDPKVVTSQTSPTGSVKALVKSTDVINRPVGPEQHGGYKREQSECHEYYCDCPCAVQSGISCEGGVLSFLGTVLSAAVTVCTKSLSKV